jgi:hypothetical protein
MPCPSSHSVFRVEGIPAPQAWAWGDGAAQHKVEKTLERSEGSSAALKIEPRPGPHDLGTYLPVP